MDKSLGDILLYLKENNLEEDTFVLFLSDNGGLSALERAGELHRHNAPLNSGKGSAYEGGIRIPIIAQWKTFIKANTQTDIPIIIEDVFPTLLDIAQVKSYSVPQIIDGKSFLSILEGKKFTRKRALFWHTPNNWYNVEGHGIGASSSIRWGKWKLIYMHKTQQIELFDLKKDIGETTNLAQKYPKRTKKLACILTDYLKEVQAQMPIDKKTNKVVPYPIETIR